VEEIKKDIDAVKHIKDKITESSVELGLDGKLTEHVFRSFLEKHSKLTSSPTFVTVFNWLVSGGKTVFLQDANSLIMKTDQLIEVLTYLKRSFPCIERITSYARAKTALKKPLDELTALKEAGLSRLHVGLETGDDRLLEKVKKGVTAAEHIRAGKKVVNSGIELSTYIMPGLGGLDLSIDHATNTAKVLNEINPEFIRSRPFIPRQGTPIFDEYKKGDFRLLPPHSIIREIGMLAGSLTVASKLCFDHAMNPSYRSGFGIIPLFDQDYEGYRLPDRKEEVLGIVDQGLNIPESRYIKAQDLISVTL